MINSSINLLIYCMVGARFRSVFYQKILCRNTIHTCQCLQNSEESKCPQCGRRLVGLRTVQRSGGEVEIEEIVKGEF